MAMKLLKKFFSLFTPSKNMHSSIFSVNVEYVYVTKVAIGDVPAGTKLRELSNGSYLLGDNTVFTAAEVGNAALFEKKVSMGDVTETTCGCDETTGCSACGTPDEEEAAPIDETPAFNASAVLNDEVYNKLLDAVAEQKAIADGQQYFFYHVGEKRWAKATMERTSSDLGRLMSGFALPITTTTKSKRNRLAKLNAVFGLGLTDAEVSAIANA